MIGTSRLRKSSALTCSSKKLVWGQEWFNVRISPLCGSGSRRGSLMGNNITAVLCITITLLKELCILVLLSWQWAHDLAFDWRHSRCHRPTVLPWGYKCYKCVRQFLVWCLSMCTNLSGTKGCVTTRCCTSELAVPSTNIDCTKTTHNKHVWTKNSNLSQTG